MVDENAVPPHRRDTHALSADIDDEIQTVHNFVRDQYRVKFPELESLVTHPIDYARVVRAIGNEMDVTRVDLDAVLPSAAVMVVSVTAATTAGAPLSEATSEETLAACDRQMQMDEDRRQLVQLVQSRMDRTAPNLSAVLGSNRGAAHGRRRRAHRTVQDARQQLAGARAEAEARRGVLRRGGGQGGGHARGSHLPVRHHPAQDPARAAPRAARLVAGKVRAHGAHGRVRPGPGGERGQSHARRDRGEDREVAGDASGADGEAAADSRRRGKEAPRRKRARAMKERYGQSDMQKAANRLNFNQAEEEYGLDGEGLGTLGTSAGMAAASGSSASRRSRPR